MGLLQAGRDAAGSGGIWSDEQGVSASFGGIGRAAPKPGIVERRLAVARGALDMEGGECGVSGFRQACWDRPHRRSLSDAQQAGSRQSG